MRLLLLPAALLLLAAAPPVPVPAYHEFGRWLVACDNTRACVARGFDDVTRAQLDLIRPAGQAPAELKLSAETPVDPAAVQLDGKPFPLAAPAWSGGSTRDPAAVDAFIAAARNGQSLTLDKETPADADPRTVPLNGFMAAVLFMDAVQGRVGTPTALVATKGSDDLPPAIPVPKAPAWTPPPPLTPAQATRLRQGAAALRSPLFDCNVKEKPDVYALDATRALAIRPCYMAAYQSSSVVAVLPRAGGTPQYLRLALPGLPHHAVDGPDMVNPEFDPAHGTLTVFSKGRGLADCGASESWVWSAGAFHMTAFNYQGQCGGAEPGDFPALVRTR